MKKRGEGIRGGREKKKGQKEREREGEEIRRRDGRARKGGENGR